MTAPAFPPTGAVVVTYFPDPGFATRLAVIAREVAPILVIDNSADPAVHARLAAVCASAGCKFIASPANVGLATALNRGFALLRARGRRWAIAFDQDSTPAPGFAAALHATAVRQPVAAAIGANWTDEARPDLPSRHLHACCGVGFRRRPAAADLPDVTCVIASGTLFALPVWHALGGFDDTLFLDLVDTEFCLRARAAGHRIAVAAAARLVHRRGAKHPVRFLGHTFWPAGMPPPRLRGLSRNRILVAARHGWHAPHWVAFECAFAAKIFGEIVFLEPAKFSRLAACLHGCWDGLLGVDGPVR
jgi:rhamnosyltransferase